MKPVIFFSHASSDRDAIVPIRDRLLEGTGNAIDVFMSCDGSSIPFGRNWLKEIEDALHSCKLMFVLMTPSSVQSNWIPFEAGHAYAREIRVVPVGLLGTKLDSIRGPMKSIQGFDVTTGKGLNNIVRIINEVFQLTFPDLFDSSFFADKVETKSLEFDPEILDYVHRVTCDFGTVKAKGTVHLIRADAKERFSKILDDLGIDHVTNQKGYIVGPGFKISFPTQMACAEIDPYALNLTRQVWPKALAEIYDTSDIPFVTLCVVLNGFLSMQKDAMLINSRLLNSPVEFDTDQPHETFRYRNIQFRMSAGLRKYRDHPILVVKVPRDNDAPLPVLSLLQLLKERRILE